ncbi:MAG: hypothetical protein ABJH07_10535 [Sedimentitalea sp.]|uniref:hypothetical protein n=1 Tax=Sedimentitalea sp. TaxID=2048915 RepID=UPI0032639DD4
MKVSELTGPITAYERLAAQTAAAVLSRADLAAKLGGGSELVKVIDGFGDADKFADFAAKMPKHPPLEDVIKAFGTDVADIGNLVNDILKGNTGVLVALAEQGCGRDPAQLKALSDELKKDPKPLQDMIAEAGMGNNPEALAAIFDSGCGQDPAKLQAFCKKFGKKEERERLAGVLDQGGLGQAPAVLAALAKEGDGDLLKTLSGKFTSDDDKDALRGLLTETALDGRAPSNPDLLRNMIVDGLESKPERLKKLHGAFTAAPDPSLSNLNRVLTGLDGDDGKGGKRLDRLFKALKSRDPTISDQALADHLRDPFLKTFATQSAACKTPPIGGPESARASIEVAQTHSKPSKAASAGALAGNIDPAQATNLLTIGIADDEERGEFAEAMAQAGAMEARGAALQAIAARGDGSQTAQTKIATAAAVKATAEMDARLDGAAPDAIAALIKLADAAMAAAEIEPDDGERTKAIEAAKAAAVAAQTAAKRAAATAMAGSAGGGAAAAAGQALKSLPKTPPNTPPTPLRIAAESYAETARDTAVAEAALTAAKLGAAASAAANAKVLKGQASKEATKAAQDAANTSKNMAEVVEAAPRPVDPALLVRAAALADAALTAGRAVADQSEAEKAFDAGKDVTDAIAAAVNEAAARIAMDNVRENAEGKKALKNLAVADACNGIAASTLKPGSEGGTLAASHADILSGAKTGDDLAAYGLSATQKADAETEAKAKAGANAQQSEIDTEIAKLKDEAIQAQQAANTAAANLAAAVPSDNPANFNLLLKAAAEAAKNALAAAKNVVDDAERAKTITSATDCAKAIRKASEIPSVKMVTVAVKAKADLDVAATSARGAAMTAAAADELLNATPADLKKAAADTAYRAAAEQKGTKPENKDLAAATGQSRTDAINAKDAVDLAVSTLGAATPAADSEAYAKLIKDLSDKAEAALVAARDTVDDNKRKEALSAAKTGAQAAAAAAKTLADHHLAEAEKAASAKMNEDMQDLTGHLLADPNNPSAVPANGVNKTFERGKAAIADAAATLLAQRAEADPAVRAATELAEEKQSKAELPGADQEAKLDALVAARDAAKLLAEKAVVHFAGPPPAQWGGLVSALPAAAPAANAPMPVNPGPEEQFQGALTAGQAASSATTAARAAAQKVEICSKAFEKELKAIKKRTKAETDALNAVTSVMNGAKAVTDGIVASQEFVAEGLKEVRNGVKKYTVWANQNHANTAGLLALQATAGFAGSAFEDTKVAAVSEADLIRVSAGLIKKPYTGNPIVPANGVQGGTVDMAHITDRHVAETYLFDAESSPKGSEHDIGILLGGALAGVSNTNKTNAQKDLIREGGRNKPNSFFPEDMKAPDAKQLAEAAMQDAVSSNIHTTMWNQYQAALATANQQLSAATTQSQTTKANNAIANAWTRAWYEHNYANPNPPPNAVAVGLNFHTQPANQGNAASMLNARMFYPKDGDKLSTPDVLIAAKALGVAQ